MTSPYWPLFDLKVITPALELRYPDDKDVDQLAALAGQGVHPPDFMPFLVQWSTLPSPERERSVLQWHWRQRAEWTVKAWNLPLVAVHEGTVVGTQGFGARDFERVRTVNSGSWLGLEHQGKGLGKEMRSAMLHLAFEGLGAEVAYSGAWEDNGPSIGVSRALGYVDNGDKRLARGESDVGREILFKLDRSVWLPNRRDDVTIHGLDSCRELFFETGS